MLNWKHKFHCSKFTPGNYDLEENRSKGWTILKSNVKVTPNTRLPRDGASKNSWSFSIKRGGMRVLKFSSGEASRVKFSFNIPKNEQSIICMGKCLPTLTLQAAYTISPPLLVAFNKQLCGYHQLT